MFRPIIIFIWNFFIQIICFSKENFFPFYNFKFIFQSFLISKLLWGIFFVLKVFVFFLKKKKKKEEAFINILNKFIKKIILIISYSKSLQIIISIKIAKEKKKKKTEVIEKILFPFLLKMIEYVKPWTNCKYHFI